MLDCHKLCFARPFGSHISAAAGLTVLPANCPCDRLISASPCFFAAPTGSAWLGFSTGRHLIFEYLYNTSFHMCRTSDAELFRLTSEDGSRDLRRSFSLASGAATEDLVVFTLPPGQQDAAAALLAVCKQTTVDELQITFQDGEQLQVGTLDAAAGCWPAFSKRCCVDLLFDVYSSCRSACPFEEPATVD